MITIDIGFAIRKSTYFFEFKKVTANIPTYKVGIINNA